MNIIYDSKSVTLTPNGAEQLINGNMYSNMVFKIPGLIEDKAHVLYNTVKVTHAEFPFSFYVVNNTNNFLSLSVGDYTFENGNYNAIQFQTYLKSLLPSTFSITLSPITGRFTISNNAYFFINPSSTCGRILGFDNGTHYYSSLNKIELPFPCNFTMQNLYIKTPNLLLENYNSFTKDNNTLRNIQINTSPFGMILYENKSNSKNLVKNINAVDELLIQIYDDYGNLVDFNNIPWTITLQVESAIELSQSKTISDVLSSILSATAPT